MQCGVFLPVFQMNMLQATGSAVYGCAEVRGATVWKIVMLLLNAVRMSDLIYHMGKISSCN